MEMNIDGEKVGLTKKYTFAKKGNHIVYFYGPVNTLYSTQTMFKDVRKLHSISFSPLFNTGNVTTMRMMFYECVDLKSIDLRYFDTSKVTNMEYMFANCWNLESLDVSHFNYKLYV